MSRHIIVLGMPGAGKDTQCDLLVTALGATVMKTGNVARELAKTNTEVAQVLQKGGLVRDDLINAELAKMIEKVPPQSDIVYDGFPRRLEQAKWLDDYLAKRGERVSTVFYLSISRSTAAQRLSARGRVDDTSTIIEHRLDVFGQETAPVLAYFTETNRLVEIDGEPPVEVIHKNIISKLRTHA